MTSGGSTSSPDLLSQDAPGNVRKLNVRLTSLGVKGDGAVVCPDR